MQPTETLPRKTAISPAVPLQRSPYLALHQLFRRITTVEEAKEHQVLFRAKEVFLEETPFDPDSVPPRNLANLVASGALFAFQSQRIDQLDEVSAQWPMTGRDRRRALQFKRLYWNTPQERQPDTDGN